MKDPGSPFGREKVLSSNTIAALVGEVTDAWRMARDEYATDDEIIRKLDEASGLLDEVWQMLLDVEVERG